MTKIMEAIMTIMLIVPPQMYAGEVLDVDKLMEAIRRSENSYNHPFGILKSYCKPGDPDGQCAKGCRQTIEKWMRLLKWNTVDEFIEQFGGIYAPRHVTNDPHDLNNHWVTNVRYWYHAL